MRVCRVVAAVVLAAGFGAATVAAEEGKAVYYSDYFQGRTTASGEVFDQNLKTAAHKKLPFGTRVRVTNLDNDKSVVVTINDRMARRNTNLIDLSRSAAQEIDMVRRGVVPVRIEVLE
jgi:rare lipoprotein A